MVVKAEENLIALESRLFSTCCSRCASNLIFRSRTPFITALWIRILLTFSACIRCIKIVSSRRCFRLAVRIIGTISPPSSTLLSRRSCAWHINSLAQLLIILNIFYISSETPSRASRLSENCIIPLIGTIIYLLIEAWCIFKWCVF